ncbi:hypothetical protein LTR37_000073 [Vermiconidia calcicola]|uniref:Uncharacterized protein n=1 Tax=Vermiconidia calcicola TaxID=1690605 RepID=A0ACC3NZV7_9PEZI|nr:hypothetical protein LTR37_000073 [Vermiconidia calcicola]
MEQRAFRFFRENTIRQLSGFYDCEFWDRTILQAAHVDAGVRCAVIALSSVHEGFEKTGKVSNVSNDFALKQYDLAIRQHLDDLSAVDTDISKTDSYIASCMIFTCIELLQGHYLSAVSLVKGAVRLFYECNLDLGRNTDWPLEVLEALLSRLQSQAVGLLGPSAAGATVPPRLKAAAELPIPQQFKSATEAKECLEFYSNLHVLSRFSAAASEPVEIDPDIFQYLLQIFSRWSAAFESLLASLSDDISDRDRKAVAVLKVWQALTGVGIRRHFEHPTDWDDQTLWDYYQSESEQVVAFAEIAVGESTHTAGSPVEAPYQFTMEAGITGQLYDISRQCRDPVTRRKAIHLLRAHRCREGLWDSLLAARVAERQMELEEACVPEVRAAADIPGWARVTSAVPTFRSGERWASIVFTRQQPWDGSEPKSFHEIIEL